MCFLQDMQSLWQRKMTKEKYIFVDDCRNIQLKILLIGYRSQGESVIFQIYDAEKKEILYDGAIDSYELQGKNKTIDFLGGDRTKKLDFLCWSHPDKDHSVGLVDVMNVCCDGKTNICIPGTLDEHLNQKETLSESSKIILDKILNHCKDNPNNISTVDTRMGDRVEEIFFQDNSLERVRFRIWGIAPSSGEITNWKLYKKERVKNILSVGLLLELGKYRFLLTGDMPDESIQNVYGQFFNDVVLVKIPHHGSDGSGTMIDALSASPSIHLSTLGMLACTTVFTPKSLPLDDILDKYMGIGCSRIDSTHTGPDLFGCVEYNFDVFDSQRVTIRHHGNACMVRPR